MYLTWFLDKFYGTFSECLYVNRSTDGDLILTQNIKCSLCGDLIITLECGPMPNVMAALPNIIGALCSTMQTLADAHY